MELSELRLCSMILFFHTSQGMAAKYQSTIALARLRERGDREAVGEGFADLDAESHQPARIDRGHESTRCDGVMR
jgi:hypothetical protein